MLRGKKCGVGKVWFSLDEEHNWTGMCRFPYTRDTFSPDYVVFCRPGAHGKGRAACLCRLVVCLFALAFPLASLLALVLVLLSCLVGLCVRACLGRGNIY